MPNLDFYPQFYKNKRVLVTGHTGFKGTWLCRMLIAAGATVTGFALAPSAKLSLFTLTNTEKQMRSVIGDVRDREALQTVFRATDPEIVFHLAAQPIVREGYRSPVYTYETNVMGTVYLLECVRESGNRVRSLLNVTTDKVYESSECPEGYRESDPLDGFDPYSNSKSCAELVTHAYQRSFFSTGGTALSTARAGNVIGGGDFAHHRIVPDCVRAALQKSPVTVRNPHSVRPYQHVLDPLFAYLMIAARQYENEALGGWYNVGPDDGDCLTTGKLVDLFIKEWGEGLRREDHAEGGPHEAGFLRLNCEKLKSTFGWQPVWDIQKAVRKTVQWTKLYRDGADMAAVTDRQIDEFFADLCAYAKH